MRLDFLHTYSTNRLSITVLCAITVFALFMVTSKQHNTGLMHTLQWSLSTGTK